MLLKWHVLVGQPRIDMEYRFANKGCNFEMINSTLILAILLITVYVVELLELLIISNMSNIESCSSITCKQCVLQSLYSLLNEKRLKCRKTATIRTMFLLKYRFLVNNWLTTVFSSQTVMAVTVFVTTLECFSSHCY